VQVCALGVKTHKKPAANGGFFLAIDFADTEGNNASRSSLSADLTKNTRHN